MRISKGKEILDELRKNGNSKFLDTKEDLQKLKRIAQYMKEVKLENRRRQKLQKTYDETHQTI
jgi:hypothetical protein